MVSHDGTRATTVDETACILLFDWKETCASFAAPHMRYECQHHESTHKTRLNLPAEASEGVVLVFVSAFTGVFQR